MKFVKVSYIRIYEIDKIVETFLNRDAVEDFSVAVTYSEIIAKNYSLSAGQYFNVKILCMKKIKRENVRQIYNPFVAVVASQIKSRAGLLQVRLARDFFCTVKYFRQTVHAHLNVVKF